MMGILELLLLLLVLGLLVVGRGRYVEVEAGRAATSHRSGHGNSCWRQQAARYEWGEEVTHKARDEAMVELSIRRGLAAESARGGKRAARLRSDRRPKRVRQ